MRAEVEVGQRPSALPADPARDSTLPRPVRRPSLRRARVRQAQERVRPEAALRSWLGEGRPPLPRPPFTGLRPVSRSSLTLGARLLHEGSVHLIEFAQLFVKPGRIDPLPFSQNRNRFTSLSVEGVSPVVSLSPPRRVWWNVARCRGAMLVPRQGRRECAYAMVRARLRTPHRGEQRGPATQTTFRRALLVARTGRASRTPAAGRDTAGRPRTRLRA